MAFPNNTEVSNAANTLGVDPIVEYAYAAVHGRVLTNPADAQAFETQVTNLAAAAYRPEWTTLVYGYIQSHGIMPSSVWSSNFINWAIQQGYLSPPQPGGNPEATGSVPFPGEGYPPGNQATNPEQTPTSTQQPPTSGGVDLSSLVKNPFVLGGAALVGAYALGIFPRRR